MLNFFLIFMFILIQFDIFFQLLKKKKCNINNMKLIKTAILAIIFGSLYTIFRKYQSVAQLSNPEK